jgi:hypothetical protein
MAAPNGSFASRAGPVRGVILVRVRLITQAAVFAVAATLTAAADGQEASDLQRAERDFRQALADEDAGAWEKALAEFVEAGALAHKETPQFLYHRGLCHAKLGKLVLARAELVEAAARAQQEGLENVATTSKAQLAEVQPRIASLALTPPARGEVTAASVDGVDATGKLGTDIDLDPGVHEVHVTYAGAPPANLHVTLRDGERRALAIPEPALAPSPGTPPTVLEATRHGAGSGKTIGWILLGSGAALGAVGAVFWVLRDGTVSTLSPLCGPMETTCPAPDQSVIDRGKLDNVLAVTLFSVGGAAALTGAGILLFGGSHGPETTGARLAPLVTARGGGIELRGVQW